MYTNVYGTFSVHTCGEYGYFITSINDFSRFGYVENPMSWINSFNLRQN